MQIFLRIPRVAEAFRFMVEAHENQKYGNLPYFVHPLMVAETLFEQFYDASEDEIITALLHDVVEDTRYTIQDIADRFGDTVAQGVALLTKNEELDYQENILMIISSKFTPAMRVKWADNKINMSGDKSHMAPERRHKLNTRYAGSFVLLSAALGI